MKFSQRGNGHSRTGWSTSRHLTDILLGLRRPAIHLCDPFPAKLLDITSVNDDGDDDTVSVIPFVPL
jgi:hypothetical protein